MAITQRGMGWELKASLWVLLPLVSVGLLTWAAFLYAGARVRHRPWLAASAVYLAVTVAALRALPPPDQAGGAPWAGFAAIGLLFGGLVHALVARPAFLIRLDARQAGAVPARAPDTPLVPAPPAVPDTQAAPVPPAPPRPVATPVAPAAAEPPAAPVDLNVAPEHTVAALPGVGPILAKLVVEERAARNGFASVDEFGDVLGLKPHVLERLRGHVFTGPRPVRHRPGRQVDY